MGRDSEYSESVFALVPRHSHTVPRMDHHFVYLKCIFRTASLNGIRNKERKRQNKRGMGGVRDHLLQVSRTENVILFIARLLGGLDTCCATRHERSYIGGNARTCDASHTFPRFPHTKHLHIMRPVSIEACTSLASRPVASECRGVECRGVRAQGCRGCRVSECRFCFDTIDTA